jgi:hypothetical protein
MASTNNPRGIPSIASTLIRPTTKPTPREDAEAEKGEAAAEDRDDQADAGEGQGGSTGSKPSRSRRRSRPAPGGEVKGRKLSLPDDLYDRLQLQAIQKRTTISAVAADILDRNLPRFRIERDG